MANTVDAQEVDSWFSFSNKVIFIVYPVKGIL